MERTARIELATECLEGTDSANELRPRNVRKMAPRPRIEREPPALQAGVQADYTISALVGSALVAEVGVEPTKTGL